jgi:ribosomal subunit interface protein
MMGGGAFSSSVMKILISGKHLDLDERFRSKVEKRIDAGISKYFDAAIEAHVVVSREGSEFRTDCPVHVGSGIAAQSHAVAAELHSSFDAAAERLENNSVDQNDGYAITTMVNRSRCSREDNPEEIVWNLAIY